MRNIKNKNSTPDILEATISRTNHSSNGEISKIMMILSFGNHIDISQIKAHFHDLQGIHEAGKQMLAFPLQQKSPRDPLPFYLARLAQLNLDTKPIKHLFEDNFPKKSTCQSSPSTFFRLEQSNDKNESATNKNKKPSLNS